MTADISPFEHLQSIAQDPDSLDVLLSAKEFKATLLEAISKAQHRIYMTALYLEDDDAGREIMTALYEAKKANPDLDIVVCVDWHRAQRGLIGAEASEGNAAMYKEYAAKYANKIDVYGVPVSTKEVFGVLHLKGFIIDHCVIYSGASINNIYLQQQDRYRADRYHRIINPELADTMVCYIQQTFIADPAVNDLCSTNKPTTRDIKTTIKQFRKRLRHSAYRFTPSKAGTDQVAVTPIVSVGKKNNQLNQMIVTLLSNAKDDIFIFTPYFNFPKEITKAVSIALSRGVKVTIVIGDKKANDFFIPPDQPFKIIGGIPYLYEINLRRFAKKYSPFLENGNLSIKLWQHNDNSFHLKGVWVDQRYIMLTGNNLNPRAWSLDLENGLLIQDPHQLLAEKFQREADTLLTNTTAIRSYKDIENIKHYPQEVRKLLRKIVPTRADKILKRIL